jgi:hypothetical protein
MASPNRTPSPEPSRHRRLRMKQKEPERIKYRLKYQIDGVDISLDDTIYSIIHRYEGMRRIDPTCNRSFSHLTSE